MRTSVSGGRSAEQAVKSSIESGADSHIAVRCIRYLPERLGSPLGALVRCRTLGQDDGQRCGMAPLGLGEGLSVFTKIILVVAIAFGTINVVGGFVVTDRMLEMFKSKPAPPKQADEEAGS